MPGTSPQDTSKPQAPQMHNVSNATEPLEYDFLSVDGSADFDDEEYYEEVMMEDEDEAMEEKKKQVKSPAPKPQSVAAKKTTKQVGNSSSKKVAMAPARPKNSAGKKTSTNNVAVAAPSKAKTNAKSKAQASSTSIESVAVAAVAKPKSVAKKKTQQASNTAPAKKVAAAPARPNIVARNKTQQVNNRSSKKVASAPATPTQNSVVMRTGKTIAGTGAGAPEKRRAASACTGKAGPKQQRRAASASTGKAGPKQQRRAASASTGKAGPKQQPRNDPPASRSSGGPPTRTEHAGRAPVVNPKASSSTSSAAVAGKAPATTHQPKKQTVIRSATSFKKEPVSKSNTRKFATNSAGGGGKKSPPPTVQRPPTVQDASSSGSRGKRSVTRHKVNKKLEEEAAEKPEFTRRSKSKAVICGIVFASLVIIGACVAVYFLVLKKDSHPRAPNGGKDQVLGPTPAPTPPMTWSPTGPGETRAPTTTPSLDPTSIPSTSPILGPSPSPTRNVEDVLFNFFAQDYGVDVGATNARKAIDWLVEEAKSSNKQIKLSPKYFQRFSILALYNSLVGDDSRNVSRNRGAEKTLGTSRASDTVVLPNWGMRNQNECFWKGMTCDSEGRLTEIRLADLGLEGELPTELRYFSDLKHLDLSNNRIQGTIPEELFDLEGLQKVYLYDNQLSGSISSNIGNIWSLTHFHVSHNQLTGSIPATLGSRSKIRQIRKKYTTMEQCTLWITTLCLHVALPLVANNIFF
eukprot:scaffold14945_cov119-Cylindrotheca_fusiformis.AAC.1